MAYLFRPSLILSLVLLICIGHEPASADNVVETPVLSVIGANDRGVFRVMVISWNKQASPDPIEIKWGNSRVRVLDGSLGALHAAFQYALERTPTVSHTGTITIYNASYAPMSADGPSSGAVVAVGLIAVLRGDKIIRGIALTGTLEPDGRIGPVGGVPDKVRAAVREGYRMILIPSGQVVTSRWNLNDLALELNVTIKEVATIDEAYELMTGQALQ